MTFVFGNLAHRHLQPELMDQPDLDPREHVEALEGLRRINRWSKSAGILWPPICHLLSQSTQGSKPITILDLATGGGDVAVDLCRRARISRASIRMDGIDRSGFAIETAGRAARHAGVEGELQFMRCDVLHDAWPAERYDIIMCSLFLHHLTEEEAVALLRRMAGSARHLVLANDLRRSHLGLALAALGSRLLSRSSIVHHDALRSVEGACTVAEMKAIAEQAGLRGASVEPRWPFRMLLAWRREEAMA